jgi:hypothetical protein
VVGTISPKEDIIRVLEKHDLENETRDGVSGKLKDSRKSTYLN